ncbi:MAG: GMC family oxidoreductase [Elusimicrobia bacterium]|nr:GMC family oxidoreductase [Elusimicrobiota bacterium]
MSFGTRLIADFALDCAAVRGDKTVEEGALRETIERRAMRLPFWAFLLAASAAFALQWLMPLILLGKPRRFQGLSPEEADLLLERLQLVTLIPVRGPFLALKSLVLPVLYGLSAKPATTDRSQAVPADLSDTGAASTSDTGPAPAAPAARLSSGGRWDVVVAGSGAGGAAVAARLAQGGAKVLLLEKGGWASSQPDACEAVSRYYTGAGFVAALGRCMIPVPTGTAVGGTTAINSGTCMRAPGEALERWEEIGRGRFTKAEFERRLDEAWRLLKVREAPARTFGGSSRLVLQGLSRLGGPTAEPVDRCEDGCEGSGRCCFACPTSAKITSSKAFLEPLQGDPRLTLSPRTYLTGIRPPAKAGDSVQLTVRRKDSGLTEDLECGRLVLAAGTLATPYFVRRFRLGSAWRLAGDGLSLHPASKVFGLFQEPVDGWKGVPQGLGFDDQTDPAIRYEGVFTPPEMAAVTMPLEGGRLRWWMDRYRHVATFGFMIRDAARGTVRHPFGPGLPVIRYDLTPKDLSRMTAAMRFVARVFFAAGASRVLMPINARGNEIGNPTELDAEALRAPCPSQLYSMAFHPLGTCAMGRVVDEDLRLTPGIFVCDGSVVPESLGVNPQMTIYAFALRLADHLLCAT